MSMFSMWFSPIFSSFSSLALTFGGYLLIACYLFGIVLLVAGLVLLSGRDGVSVIAGALMSSSTVFVMLLPLHSAYPVMLPGLAVLILIIILAQCIRLSVKTGIHKNKAQPCVDLK